MRAGVSPHGNRLSYEDRLTILERIAAGETLLAVARELGTTNRTVSNVIAIAGGRPSRRSRRTPRSPLRLSLLEREEIRAGIAAGDSFRAIARRIGRAPSTVSREVGGLRGGRCAPSPQSSPATRACGGRSASCCGSAAHPSRSPRD